MRNRIHRSKGNETLRAALAEREKRIWELETKGRKLLEAFAMGDDWIKEYNEFDKALKASE